jgi:hypothetical protein
VADVGAPTGTGLTPEYVLLVAAATGERPPEGLAVDWLQLLRLARWHRLEPLLARSLQDRPGIAVPGAAMAVLQQARMETVARNLCMRSELPRVVAALGEEDIPVMVLKGAALIETAYEDPSLRPMLDLDILVPEQEIEQAHRVIQRLGFTAVSQTPAGAASMRRHSHQFPALVSNDGRVGIDVHRHLLDLDHPLSFDLSGMWDRARASPLGGAHLVPAAEDLLVHVALHSSASRLWRSDGALGQLGDIAWLVEHDPVDWDLVSAGVRRDRLAGPVFLSLLLAREVLGVGVPSDLLADLRPRSFRVGLARRCIADRVLADRPTLPAVSATKRPKPLHHRLLPPPAALARRTTSQPSPRVLLMLYAGHGARVVGLVVRSLPRPFELVRGLVLNRWLHSLSRVPRRPRVPLPGHER